MIKLHIEVEVYKVGICKVTYYRSSIPKKNSFVIIEYIMSFVGVPQPS